MSLFARRLGLELLKAALVAMLGVLLKELAESLHERIDLGPEDWQ